MGLDGGGAEKLVGVGDGGQGASGGLVLAAAEVHVAHHGASQAAVVVAEDSFDRRVLERRALHEDLRVRPRVDPRLPQVREERAVRRLDQSVLSLELCARGMRRSARFQGSLT